MQDDIDACGTGPLAAVDETPNSMVGGAVAVDDDREVCAALFKYALRERLLPLQTDFDSRSVRLQLPCHCGKYPDIQRSISLRGGWTSCDSRSRTISA